MKNHTLTRRAFGALSLSAGVALAQPVWSKAEAPGYTFPHLLVEPDELAALMTEAPAKTVLVDVRIREEYDAGHIAGAAHVDPSAVVASHSPVDGSLKPIGALEMLLGGLGVTAERRVILYDDRGGFHAARMFWLLEYLGHRNVAVLNGGYSGWAKAGGETSSTAPTVDPGVFHAAPSPRRFASAQDVLLHRDAADGMLIDVRPTGLFAKGYIPWAVNIPWAANLDDEARFLPADALTAHFERNGVSPEKDVIIHCQQGLASSHSYVALRLLGFPRVRVYHRSWAEWGNDPSLPKVTA